MQIHPLATNALITGAINGAARYGAVAAAADSAATTRAAAQAAASATVNISAAARALQAAHGAHSSAAVELHAASTTGKNATAATATGTQETGAQGTGPATGYSAAFDTNHGRLTLDIEAYFTPSGNQSVDLGSLPLLMPSQKNIDALSGYISERMPAFLAQHGIPRAPASISYDSLGKIQLPDDYPYAAEFREALAADDVMERALRTTAALTSVMVEIGKSIPFQQEYAAASTHAEIEAVLAKYHYLFTDNRHYDSITLEFDAAGRLTLRHDGQPLEVA